jgi:hypothetical protein
VYTNGFCSKKVGYRKSNLDVQNYEHSYQKLKNGKDITLEDGKEEMSPDFDPIIPTKS